MGRVKAIEEEEGRLSLVMGGGVGEVGEELEVES